jgi:hypothetical protein
MPDTVLPPDWDKAPPQRAWCYQEKASTATPRVGLKCGFGAYCYYSQQNCETARSGSSTASACAYLTNISPNLWRGRPSPGGYLHSWYRTTPLDSPFPIPPSQTQTSK